MWTQQKDKKLKELLKEYREQSLPDPSHDIQFVANLIEGHEGESIVREAISKAEVKRDYGFGKSRSVFIEHASRGKPSGLQTSEADWWILLLAGEGLDSEVFVGVKKERLQRITDSIKWSVNGGDNKTSKGKLVRLTKILKPMEIEEV